MSLLIGGALPVGSIIQSPYTIADPNWLRCDGRLVLATSYPLLAAIYNGPGAATITARTLNAAANTGFIIGNSAYFVASGPDGTASQLQSSPTGGTWTGRTPIGTTWSPKAGVWDGTNFIVCDPAAQTYYAPDPTGAWTSCGVGVIASATAAYLCNAPSLPLVLLVAGGVANSAVLVSSNHGVSFSSQTTASSQTKTGCVWTGSKFFVTTANTALAQTSATGLTGSWVDQTLPFNVNAGGFIASDGNGTIVCTGLSGLPGIAAVSKDHGATWSFVSLPTNQSNTGFGAPNFVNGVFICFSPASSSATNAPAFITSTDGLSWQWTNVIYPSGTANGLTPLSAAYCSGVYATVPTGSVQAFSFTFDNTKLILPTTSTGSGFAFQDWIKAN